MTRERRKEEFTYTNQPRIVDKRRYHYTSRVWRNGVMESEVSSELVGLATSLMWPNVPRLKSRSIIRDENHVTPRPPKPPRVKYSKAQKRWLRKHGLWPPFQYRPPWKRRVVICDGPVEHERIWTKGGNFSVTFTPKRHRNVVSHDDATPTYVSDEVWEPAGGPLSFDPGAMMTEMLKPPEGYRPWEASQNWSAGLNLARRNALENFLPKLGYGFQGILNLLEAGDFPKLANEIRHMATWNNALKYKHRIRKFWDLIVDAALNRNLGKHVSNKGLLYQFALMPVVSDLNKLLLTVADGRKQLQNFLNHAGSNQVSHCQEAIRLPRWDVNQGLISLEAATDQTFLGAPLWEPPGTSNNILELQCKLPYIDWLVPSKVKYHLTVRYSMYVPDLGGLETFLLALDEFGLGPNVSQYWAHIPFSFMVDWVVPVSKWLEEHVDKFGRLFEVHVGPCVESVSVDWQRVVGKVMNPDELLRVRDHLGIQGFEYDREITASDPVIWQGRYYTRKPINGLPAVSGPPLRLPTGMKLVSTALLVMQRVKTV